MAQHADNAERGAQRAPGTRWTRLRAGWAFLTRIPEDPAVLESHRETVLTRTRIAAWVAAVVMPVTIMWFSFTSDAWTPMFGLVASAVADAGALLVLLTLRIPFFRRVYHLPFFLLVGVVCSSVESVLFQLTGGAQGSNFLFPYFLILFGIATLFPARVGWGVAAALMCPLTFLVGELALAGGVEAGKPLFHLNLLVNTAFIAAIGNRVTTRTFFREVENRRALELANERLRELDKAKSAFFANVSHDLRTPLNVIIGPVQAVVQRSEALDGRSRRYLEMALRGARRLDGMINDLLDLARIESGVLKLNLVRVELRSLVAAFVEATASYAATVGQSVQLEAPDEEIPVDVDPDKFERVLGNLVSNALKFSAAGSVVTVGLRDLGSEVELSVRDQGPGIAPNEQEHIFRRFARGAQPSGRTPRGAGIGLSVVREFVDMHGGHIEVESQLGHGATFRVALPRYSARAAEQLLGARPAERPRPAPILCASGEVPTLLLVEDDDEARVFLTAELGRCAEVIPAADGEAALRLIEDGPDIVILDVMLPGIDGLEVCRRMRQHPATSAVPILVFSARGDLHTRLQAFEAGADDFVHKPVDPLELRARVDSLLRRSGPLPSLQGDLLSAPPASPPE